MSPMMQITPEQYLLAGLPLSSFFPISLSKRAHCMQHNNQLTGQIPATLSQLPCVVDIFLHGNKFLDCIPTFKKMPQLRRLTLSFNNLTGSIPKGLETNPHLQVFCVDNNDLRGTVPNELQSHPALLQASFNNNPKLKQPSRRNTKLQFLKFTKPHLVDALAMHSQYYPLRYRRATVRVHNRVHVGESN